MKLAGKVAIVTGAGTHIGRAISLRYGGEGATVACLGRTSATIEQTAREIEAAGGKAEAIVCDVSDWSQVEAAVAGVIADFGRIDILVNNAVSWGERAPIWELDPEGWLQDIRVNLGGTFLCTRAVLPHMLERDSGKIINLSGNGSYYTPPAGGTSNVYVTSKCAICRFTEHLAAQLGDHNIQVNSLGPGYTPNAEVAETMKVTIEEEESRSGRPHWMRNVKAHDVSEGAELAVFLASSDSGSLTGRNISVDDDYRSLAATELTPNAYRIVRVTG